MLNVSIINIANPTIANEFNINISTVQWIVTAYLLVITASLLIFGRLGDYWGSEKVYLSGLLTFIIGSILCMLSPSFIWLLLARILTAFGASMIMSNEFAIVLEAVPVPDQGKATGLIFASVGLGQMLGPGLGGLLLSFFNWNSIFVVNIVIAFGTLVMAYKVLDFTKPLKRSWEVKSTNYILLALALLLLILGISSIDNWRRLALFSGAIAGFILFYFLDRKENESILDYDLFKIQPFLYGCFMVIISYATLAGTMFLLPFFLQDIAGYSPFYSGLLMIISPFFIIISGPMAGTAYDKFGSRCILIIAFILSALSFLILSQINVNSSLWLLGIALCLLGSGFSSFGPPCYNEMFSASPTEKSGYIGSLIAVFRTLANTLGPSGGVALLNLFITKTPQSLPYNQAYVYANRSVSLIFFGLAVIGLLLAIGITGKKSRLSSDAP